MTVTDHQRTTDAALPRRSFFNRQFGHPTGWLGALVGHLMAAKNAPMNRLAVEQLGVQPGDHILEIGFGPGTALQLLAAASPAERIVGIDPSVTMVRQASRRNRAAVQAGRVELHTGSAARLSFADAAFTKVFAVNSFQHWSAPGEGLSEVRRVLREGGLLLLCLRMVLPKPQRFAAPGFTEERVQSAIKLVEQAGFRDVRVVRRNVGRDVTVILAT